MKNLSSTATKFSAVTLGLLLTTLCLQSMASSDLEIKRSGVPTFGRATVGTVYWTDDDHILFIGARPGVLETLPDGRKPLKKFLMHWNTETGEVKVLAEFGGEYGSLCYDRGYVRYGFSMGKERTVKAGPLGKEANITSMVTSPDRKNFRVNQFSCREYDERSLKTTLGIGFSPLREEHGFWGGRDDALQRKMSVYIKKVDTGTEELWVPILGSRPRWSEYAGAYVFGQDHFNKTKTGAKMWLLFPDGQTKEFAIPAGPWFGGSVGYGFTKRGAFMYSYALANRGNGDAGGYLAEDGRRPERFIEGLVYEFGVSPNGCKVALNISTQSGASRGPEMVMANVCGKGN